MPDPIPAAAPAMGVWSSLFNWPIIPLHAVLLPDGRVLNYGTDVKNPDPQYPNANITTSFVYDIWSPAQGFGDASHATLTNTTGTPGSTSIDFFCSAQVLLPEPTTSSSGPSVLIVGGDTYPRSQGPEFSPPNDNSDGNPHSILVGDNGLLSKGPDMSRGRWYATVTTMPNGDIYIQGGKGRTYESGVDHPEIRSAATRTFHLLTGITTGNKAIDPEGNDAGSYRYYYPRNFVGPDGLIFGFDTFGRMYRVDPYANGGAGRLVAQTASPSGVPFYYGYQDDGSTAAMIGPGRILEMGQQSNNALLIDIRGSGDPLITPAGLFSRQRILATSTILPTGEVVLTGGSELYNELVNPSKGAEIWNPVTNAWTLGAEEKIWRLYHSTALLMPNGSVLVGGGGAPGPHADPADQNSPRLDSFNAEIYFPRYLFGADGKLVLRPRIVSVSADPQVRRAFKVDFADGTGSIARVTMVKTGSVTHGFNMDQRFVELAMRASGKTLDVRMPSNAGDITPGYYLLSVIDSAGVPSISRAVFVNVAFAPDASQDPVIANPGDRATPAGAAITPFNVVASDPNGPLTYAAGNLPPGISISGAGLVSGTPTVAGSYNAVVSASDGARTATANLVWRVN